MRRKKNYTVSRYFSKRTTVKKEKPFEKRIRTKILAVITIPEGYTMEDMMDMDASVMGGEKPYYEKEVRIVFE